MEPRKTVKKEVFLQGKLAIERTVMSNDRTLLSFIRTALYFTVAGLTLNQLVRIPHGGYIKVICFIVSAALLGTGFYKYYVQLRKIRKSRHYIGGYESKWEEDQPA